MGVHEKWIYRLAHGVLIYLVALLLTVPAFMLVFPIVPEMTLPLANGMRVDHIVTFFVLVVIFLIVVRKLQFWVYAGLLVLLGTMTFTGITGGYGFRDLYDDYAQFVGSLHNGLKAQEMALEKLGDFQDAQALREAMDFMHPSVRNFAVASAVKNFHGTAESDKEERLTQALSVFKEVNSSWKYVADPNGEEYIAKASESIAHFSGDCDDHSVLMAACIHAIGGRVRLIRTKAHVYPELFVGDSVAMENAARLIRDRLFRREARGQTLFHHTDNNGDVWLNLDYTKKYPGGEVMDESIVGILELSGTVRSD